jgi:hypothetical protein
MPLKDDFANGDQYTAANANAVAAAVNASYTKPGTGIPSTDLAAAVQTSLGKADSAVQSVSSTSITDSTTTGRSVLTAADAATARTTLGVAYGTAAGTVAQGNDSRFSPASTAISDSTATGRALITTVDASTARTTLGVAYGTSAGTVLQGAGALGTPSGGTLTNCTGLPVAGLVASTSTAVGVGSVELGHATDTTISRVSAGVVAVEGVPVVTTTGTQTLTSKTITSPRINLILDTNGATSLVLNARASAVNYINVFNESAGSPPALVLAGTDTDIGLDLAPKGAGVVGIYSASGQANSTLAARGVGANVNLNLTSKGSGTVQAGGVPVVTTTGTQTLSAKTLTSPTVTDYVESVVAIGTVTTTNTISLTNGTVQTATLTASTACTFTMPTATAGKSFILLLKQAATTGAGTATFTGVKWSGGTAPTITSTAARMDILSFVADGTNWYGSFTQNFTP